jgi:hypothetical protein
MSFYQNPYYNQNYTLPTYSSLSAIPGLSGWNALNPFDITPYLCQLLKLANVPYVDPVVKIENENGFDYEHFLDSYFAQLSAIGANERVNFGEVWKAVSLEFLPRAFTQLEIAQAGGCQVINNYICNAEGIKIQQASSTCQEGEQYLKPITSQELQTFVTNYIQVKYNNHSDGLISYIKREFINKGWSVKLIFYSKVYLFLVEASKQATAKDANGNDVSYTQKEFIKYYYDQRDYISQKLNIPITTRYTLTFDEEPQNYVALSEAMLVDKIPNYS